MKGVCYPEEMKVVADDNTVYPVSPWYAAHPEELPAGAVAGDVVMYDNGVEYACLLSPA